MYQRYHEAETEGSELQASDASCNNGRRSDQHETCKSMLEIWETSGKGGRVSETVCLM